MKPLVALIYAKDMTAMTAFYRDVMQLAVVTESAGWVEIDAGPFRFGLHAIPATIAATIAIAEPPRPRSETPIKLLFEVGDLAAARERLQAAGAELPSPRPGAGAGERVDAIDPEGNVFGVTLRA